MSKELDRLLTSPSKGVSDAKGVLAKLYRQVLADLNITPLRFQKLMERYLDDPRNGIPRDGRQRSSERGNLIKEMNRSDMTWKVFLKCLKFLDPFEIRFEIHLTWAGRKQTIHGLNMKLKEFPEEKPRPGSEHDVQKEDHS